jgi:hypothetical protein
MRLFFRTFASLALVGCGNTTTTWEAKACSLNASPTFTETTNWVDCRAGYFEEGSGIPSQFILQLMTPGSRGSFIEPAAGWLTLTFAGDQTPGTLVAMSSNGLVPLGSVSAQYAGQNGAGGRLRGGTVSMTSFTMAARGSDAPSSEFSTEMDFDLSTPTSSGGTASLTGSLRVRASNQPVSSGTGGAGGTGGTGGTGGSGGGTCNRAACDAYTAQCGGTALAPCYCAAACECACAGNTCEQQNRSRAQQLGTTCSY